MKNRLANAMAIPLFALATLAWTAAQQPGTAPDRSGGQATSPSSQAPGSQTPGSQAPGSTQTQPSTPGTADQSGSQAPSPTGSVTEGCLDGTDPNYTITDKANITYKLNIPSNADTSKLATHVGQSVKVTGNVKDPGQTGNPSIDVQGIGTGSGNCPASDSKGGQQPPQK